MPNPTAGSVHVDSLLTNISVGFVQSSTAFVADRVFPRVGVQKQSGLIPTYNQGDFQRDEVDKRAPGSPVQRSGYRVGRDSYICDEWGLAHAIDDQVVANADDPYSPKQDAVLYLTQQMMIRREREFVTNFFSTGNLWTGSSDGADLVGGTDFTRWSNAASTPIEDVHNQKARIESNTGYVPNKLVLGRQVWYDLKNHPDIVDRIKYTSGEAVSAQIIARLLDVDEVLVTSAVRNSAAEGVTADVDFIGGDDALLVYSASSPSLMNPSGGYTFVWDGLIGSNQGQVVETYRDEDAVSDIIRIRATWAQKRTAPSVGVFLTDCSTRA